MWESLPELYPTMLAAHASSFKALFLALVKHKFSVVQTRDFGDVCYIALVERDSVYVLIHIIFQNLINFY